MNDSGIDPLEKYKKNIKELEMILDNIPGLIFYKDSKDILLRVNQYFADAHHTTKKKLVGKSYFPLYHKKQAQSYLKDDLDVIKSGKPKLNIIEPRLTKEGESWLITNKLPYINDDGEITGIVGSSFDITEHLTNENLLYDIVEQSPISMWVSDDKGTFLKQNKACRDLWGVKDDELVGKFNIFDDPMIDEGNNRTLVKNAFDRGETAKITVEYRPKTFNALTRIKRKTNSVMEVTISPIIDKDGKTINAVIYQNDITERVIAKEELEAVREKYRSFISHSGEGTSIIEFDQPIPLNIPEDDQIDAIYNHGYIAMCNDEFARMYGFSLGKELIGKRILDFHGSNDNPQNIDFLRSWIRSDYKILNAESEEIDKKGDKIYISNNTIGIIENGHLIRIWGSQLNINKRKRALKALKESESMYRKSYKRAEFYKDLLSHDINNILQIILAGTQITEILIKQPEKLETSMKNIKIITEQIKRGAKLIANVRKLSKLEERKIQFEKIEICQILKKVIMMIKNLEKEKQVNIQVDSIGNKLFVKANEFLVDVFENIIFNAVKHNDKSIIKINIKISKVERKSVKFVKIEFSDNGKGIDDKRKKSIFERGYLEDRSVHGMGIGLSLVKTIMSFLNGKIWVEDRVKGKYKKGSNFVVLIPEEV